MFFLITKKWDLCELNSTLKTYLKFSKFTNKDCVTAQLDTNEFCTPENPPVHNLIFGSEEPSLNRGQSKLSLQTALEVTEMMSQSVFVIFEQLTNFPPQIFYIYTKVKLQFDLERTNKSINSSSSKIVKLQELTKRLDFSDGNSSELHPIDKQKPRFS